MRQTDSVREPTRPVGALLREWRGRRRLSQLDLAYDADISPRHLSFLETGRARPSRDMVLRLAERLEVPLRERNVLLTAAGFAPVYPERPLTDPALDAARAAVQLVLTARTVPGASRDRRWNLVASNRAVAPLLAGADPALLTPPVNVLRLGLHPNGVAPRILNLPQWRAHLLDRLGRQSDATADPALAALLRELHDYPAPPSDAGACLAGRVCRGGRATAPGDRPRTTDPVHYDDGLWDAWRRDAVRAGRGVVLPRRSSLGGAPARDGAHPASRRQGMTNRTKKGYTLQERNLPHGSHLGSRPDASFTPAFRSATPCSRLSPSELTRPHRRAARPRSASSPKPTSALWPKRACSA